MKITYTSKYGKIIKKCPGLTEYWYKGEIVARGGSICVDCNPENKPTKKDWAFCVSLRKSADGKEEQKRDAH